MLPRREHYDIEGAAEFLGCPVSDVEHYIKEGYFRYAVPVQRLGDVTVLSNDELPASIRERVETAVHPDFRVCLEIQMSAIDATKVASGIKYLYVSQADLHKFYVTEDDGFDVRAHLFEMLDSTKVSLWCGGPPNATFYSLWGERMGQLSDKKMLPDALLSREELMTLKPSSKAAEGSSVADSAMTHGPTTVMFNPPQKADEVAIDLCDFANRYVKEFSKEPGAKALAEYMTRTGKDEIAFEKSERDHYLLNGKRLSLRSIRDRLKQYRRET